MFEFLKVWPYFQLSRPSPWPEQVAVKGEGKGANVHNNNNNNMSSIYRAPVVVVLTYMLNSMGIGTSESAYEPDKMIQM